MTAPVLTPEMYLNSFMNILYWGLFFLSLLLLEYSWRALRVAAVSSSLTLTPPPPPLHLPLLPLIGQLCARPLHTWIQSHLVTIELLEGGVGHFLRAALLILPLASRRERTEKVFDTTGVELRSREEARAGGEDDESHGDAHLALLIL